MIRIVVPGPMRSLLFSSLLISCVACQPVRKPQAATPLPDPTTLRDSAFNAYKDGRFTAAIQWYEALAKQAAPGRDELFYLAHAYAFNQQADRCIATLQQLLQSQNTPEVTRRVARITDTAWTYYPLLLAAPGFAHLQEQIARQSIAPRYQAIAATLDSVYKSDQAIRQQWLAQPNPANEAALQKTDSINLSIVRPILQQYGWLDAATVGTNASRALFLTIQHADSSVLAACWPQIEKARQQNRLPAADYAFLYDRHAVYHSGRQLYGTQFYTDKNSGRKRLYPLIEPGNINTLRKGMNLPPLQAYLTLHQIEY